MNHYNERLKKEGLLWEKSEIKISITCKLKSYLRK